MSQSNLVGYARLSKDKNSIKVSISKEAFDRSKTFDTPDGMKYVGLVINLNKLRSLLSEQREVTSVVTEESP
jgi:hypothetical protein